MGLFDFLFSRSKCLIYTALGSEEYFRVVQKLTAAGVSFRTRSHYDRQRLRGSFPTFPAKDFTQYDIYVAKEDEYKAQAAIHSR